MYNVHTCISAIPLRRSRCLFALHCVAVRQCAIDASTISRTASNRWIDIPKNAHLRFPLPGPRPTPAHQMSNPSQRTSDCRPVGRSGNREKRPRATSKSWPGALLAFPASPSGFCLCVAVLSCPVLFLYYSFHVLCKPPLTQRAIHALVGAGALDALPSHTNIVPGTASNRPQHGQTRQDEAGQGNKKQMEAALRKDQCCHTRC